MPAPPPESPRNNQRRTTTFAESSRAWEQMTTSLQETVLSAGTLGTLATNDANMYVRDFPFNSTVTQLLAAGMNVARSGKGFRAVRSGQKRNAMKIGRRV